MIDKEIEYKSIIMRCNSVNPDAFIALDPNITMEYYSRDMEYIWIEIQKSVGEFAGYSDKEIYSYFHDKFMIYKEQMMQRCIFIKDKKSGKYIGTCCAWFDKKNDKIVPVLHWLAVKDEFANHGYARLLIGETLKILRKSSAKEPIYLHTQPCSYKAIKLYNDFGFCITKKDTYGTAKNEFEEAMKILKKHLDAVVYEKLIQTSIL